MSCNIVHSAEEFAAKSYDIVIVGGGTAGLALATRFVFHDFRDNRPNSECILLTTFRLAENTSLTIGVLEAGPDRSSDETIVSGGAWNVVLPWLENLV